MLCFTTFIVAIPSTPPLYASLSSVAFVRSLRRVMWRLGNRYLEANWMTMISFHFLIGVLSFSDMGPSKGLHGKVVSHPPLLEIATMLASRILPVASRISFEHPWYSWDEEWVRSWCFSYTQQGLMHFTEATGPSTQELLAKGTGTTDQPLHIAETTIWLFQRPRKDARAKIIRHCPSNPRKLVPLHWIHTKDPLLDYMSHFFLLRVLGQTRRHAPGPRDSTKEESCRRRFFKDLSYICDFDKGGSSCLRHRFSPSNIHPTSQQNPFARADLLMFHCFAAILAWDILCVWDT